MNAYLTLLLLYFLLGFLVIITFNQKSLDIPFLAPPPFLDPIFIVGEVILATRCYIWFK